MEYSMFKKLFFIVLMLGVVSCSTTPTPDGIFKDSLRTDGIYSTKNDGEKGYIRFYINEEGKKYFKSNILAVFSKVAFEKTADVIPYFSVRSRDKSLLYTFEKNGVRVKSVTSMNKFEFTPDPQK